MHRKRTILFAVILGLLTAGGLAQPAAARAASDEPPVITSDEFGFSGYPIVGQPGTFHFAPGSTGVVAYEWLMESDAGRENADGRVDAGADGKADLPYTPQFPGGHNLTVTALSADGSRSPSTYMYFDVIDNRPTISTDWYPSDQDGVGQEMRVRFSSQLPDVNGFAYRFDREPEKVAMADEGNRYADVLATPAHAGDIEITAVGLKTDGSRTPPTTIQVRVTSGPLFVGTAGPYGESPVIGREAKIKFRPALPHVVSYRWSFRGDEGTVAAAADGTGTITVTPRNHSSNLSVTSVSADGTESDARVHEVSAADTDVDVSGTWIDQRPTGKPGQPGEFSFGSDLRGAVDAYLWHIESGPVQEAIPADGTFATVPHTPDSSGVFRIYVQARFTDGALSPTTTYQYWVGR
ncbi:hypothetical protein [Actinoplanes sp. NPDC089786]|uniref:hypothetical protein n=1 Tax=Actinoplanes sp. NPDC089786 TaxID=3155185 RepID=UPI0034487E3B